MDRKVFVLGLPLALAGAVGAPPAAISALVDALHARTGAVHLDMPATPERVWRALNG